MFLATLIMTTTATVPDERHASLETPAVPNIELQDAISKVGSTRAETTTNGCCRWVHFNAVDMAKGYNIVSVMFTWLVCVCASASNCDCLAVL